MLFYSSIIRGEQILQLNKRQSDVNLVIVLTSSFFAWAVGCLPLSPVHFRLLFRYYVFLCIYVSPSLLHLRVENEPAEVAERRVYFVSDRANELWRQQEAVAAGVAQLQLQRPARPVVVHVVQRRPAAHPGR